MRQSSIVLFLVFAVVGQLALSDDQIHFPTYKRSRDLSRVPFSRLSPQTQAMLQEISKGSEAFSFELFTKISHALQNINYDFVISPFSIWCLLVLLAEGASGETFKQLHKTLHLPQDMTHLRTAYKNIQHLLVVNTSTVEIAVNQALFTDSNRPVYDDYADVLENQYDADFIPVPFSNRAKAFELINGHVKDATRGKISEIVTFDDLQDAQMILLSALFFKGQWKMPFNASETQEQPFYDEHGNFVETVKMMYQQANYKYTQIKELSSHVVEIPYGLEDRLCMVVLLPVKGITVASVFEKLAAYSIKQIMTELHKFDNGPDNEPDPDVDLYMPRFAINTDFNLNVVLESMGIKDLFNAQRADLSKVSSLKVYVSRVIHKTVIKVTEEGTVAASASSATVMFKQQPTQFMANRPFGFMIIERTTNSVLFTGQVRRPGKF